MNASAAFAGDPANEYPNAYLATRGSSGWQTTPLSPPTPQAPANSDPKLSYDFSEDLSQAVLRVPLQQLTEGAPAGVYNLYLRQPSGAYSLLTTDRSARTATGRVRAMLRTSRTCPRLPAPRANSVTSSSRPTTASSRVRPAEACKTCTKPWRVKCGWSAILPDEAIPAGGATAGAGIEASGEHAGELEHAISQDGSHVLFEAAADGGAPDRTAAR